MLSEAKRKDVQEYCDKHEFIQSDEMCYNFAFKYSFGRSVELNTEVLQDYKFNDRASLYYDICDQRGGINKFLQGFEDRDLIVWVNKKSCVQSHFMSFCAREDGMEYFVGTQSQYEKRFVGKLAEEGKCSAIAIVSPEIDLEHYYFVKIPQANILYFLVNNGLLLPNSMFTILDSERDSIK